MHCFSDHAPILLSTDGKMAKPRNTFKFENWWLREDDFQNYANNAWNQHTTSAFMQRTNLLGAKLKVWCRKKKPLQEELKSLEHQIDQIQKNPLQLQDQAKEGELMQRYEQTITDEGMTPWPSIFAYPVPAKEEARSKDT
jgi:hypothetical protein